MQKRAIVEVLLDSETMRLVMSLEFVKKYSGSKYIYY